MKALSAPINLGGTEVHVRASVGVVAVPAGTEPPNDILLCADLAMYQAKNAGKGGTCMFEPAMAGAASQRLALEGDLRRALRGGQLRLVYQPVVNLRSGHLTGTEALLRWDHPERGVIPPGDFIPMAEESGLILPIGEWVLRAACHQLADWDREVGPGTTTMAVNVSIRQIERPGFVEVVRSTLEQTDVDPSRIVLEITETALAEDDDIRAHLDALHQLGVSLSIDDFGTGYSSLGRLRSCPVNFVKLDRGFVGEIIHADSAVPILRAMVAMAAGLGLGVIAEGIETPEQLHHLRALGCREGQGFLLSRPAGPDAIRELLAAGQPLTTPAVDGPRILDREHSRR